MTRSSFDAATISSLPSLAVDGAHGDCFVPHETDHFCHSPRLTRKKQLGHWSAIFSSERAVQVELWRARLRTILLSRCARAKTAESLEPYFFQALC